VFRRWALENGANATGSVTGFAATLGMPVVHASHCGELSCEMPLMPVRYRGRYVGMTAIVDGDGRVLASRSTGEGEGFVVADVSLGGSPPARALTNRYWLLRRGVMATLAWHYQAWHGRLRYRRSMRPGSSARDRRRAVEQARR
jgi:hypothetical protein